MAALRFGDENFCRRLHDLEVKHGKGASKQRNLKDAQIEQIARSKYGKDFTILGPSPAKWHVDLARASLSGLITESKLTASPQLKHIEIPLNYDAKLIEAAVQCMYWGSYSAEKEFRFKYAHGTDKINNLEGNVTTTPLPTAQPIFSFPSSSSNTSGGLFPTTRPVSSFAPSSSNTSGGLYPTTQPVSYFASTSNNVTSTVLPTAQSSASAIHNIALFHIQVYYFGKYLKYPFLTTAALNKLQESLLSPADKVGITDFRELIALVWKPQEYESINAMLSDQKDDWDLRRTLASFGAVWDPAWRANTRDLWEELTAPDGKYQNYAFWHMTAKRDIESFRPDRELAPRVKEAMSKDFKMDEN